jgi:hypothetical protein
MEKLEKIRKLNDFLTRVKRLRGFGDMDAFALANQFSVDSKVPTEKIETIIGQFSSPQDWQYAKEDFEQSIEAQLKKLIQP